MSVSTVLAVPGSSERFVQKGFGSATAVVMLDIEDGVAESEKALARDLLSELLTTHGTSDKRAWVRINAVSTDHFSKDVEMILTLAKEVSRTLPVVLPMATADDVERVVDLLPDSPIVPMVETALGVEDSVAIARTPTVEGLMFGELDFLATMHSVGAARLSNTSWAHGRVINAAAASGKWTIAGPFPDITDGNGLRLATRADAATGFAGKLCIHPSQLTAVAEAFLPTPEEQRWARALLAELEVSGTPRGAFKFEGQMVDAPVVARARAVIASAEKAK